MLFRLRQNPVEKANAGREEQRIACAFEISELYVFDFTKPLRPPQIAIGVAARTCQVNWAAFILNTIEVFLFFCQQ